MQKESDLSWQLQQAQQGLAEKIADNDVLHNRLDVLSQKNNLLYAELDLITKDFNALCHEKADDDSIVTELKEQVDHLSVQWIDHSRQIQALESENRFIRDGWDASKLEAAHYALSRSWRLTRPMRKFIKFIKGK